jgi:hypothetical protein
MSLRVRHRWPGRCRRGLAGSSSTMKNAARPGKLGARALVGRFPLFRLSVDARRAVNTPTARAVLTVRRFNQAAAVGRFCSATQCDARRKVHRRYSSKYKLRVVLFC